MPSRALPMLIAAAVALCAVTVAAQKAGTMRVVGNSGISAQMMFLGTPSTVYMLDKAENNAAQVNGHPAWGTAYDLSSNTYRTMNVMSNTFCAGGASLGDGTWLVTGGNKAVGYGGEAATPGADPFQNTNGGKALRILRPGAGANWQQLSSPLDKERWYPTVEPLADGSAIILGGMRNGGYVTSAGQNEPTYEFWPKRNGGASQYMDLLSRTVPLSLFPIAYHLSNGQLFLSANCEAIMWNYNSQSETRLPDASVPKVYPASAGNALLPLEPSNGYKETILFCGGVNLQDSQWGNEGGPTTSLTDKSASNVCEQIQPLGTKTWERVDNLPSPRTMGQFINLPDGTLLFINGARKGTAGYGVAGAIARPVGHSYATDPELQPYIYNPKKAKGSRWSKLAYANEGRLYHSSATLLTDGSVLVSGSNPNPDVSSAQWKTSYSVERLYPSYYDSPRPSSTGMPARLSYGGRGFNISLGSSSAAAAAKVVIIRTGFSTHGMQMGQRMITLKSVQQGSNITVAQMPNNPSLFPPGPAVAFVVVNGVPSIGKMIMVGTGIGTQKTYSNTVLPAAFPAGSGSSSGSSSGSGSRSSSSSGSMSSSSSNTGSSTDSASSSTGGGLLGGIVGGVGGLLPGIIE